MWQQPIALFPPPVPGALAWRKRRCKEASQTCKTFMVGRWSAWKVSDGEWEWVRVSQTRLMSTISTENITLRSQLVKTLERSSSVIHRSLSARVQGRGLMTTEMHRSITDLRNFQSWRRSMQPEAMLDSQTIRHVEMPCFFFCEVDMLREVAQNCRKCRSQIREMSLWAATLSQARGARQINKTLQVPFPTECCGTSKSSHLFVGSGGCDLACLRKHAEPGKSARRFKTSLRLTAAEQTSVHIGSSNPVAATSDDAGNVFVQAVELRASSGMLSLTTLSLLTGVHLDSNVRGSSTVSSAVASRSK